MSEKRKLLMTASTFPRWEGDTEPRFVLDLAKALLPYFDVTVLVPGAPGAAHTEELEGVHIIRYQYLPLKKAQTLCYPGAIVPRIREKRIRIVQVPFLFISLWFSLLKNIRYYDVVQAHWLIPQGVVQSFFHRPYLVTGHGGDVASMNKGIVRKFKKRCLVRAQYITVVSEALKDILVHEYKISSDKIAVLPMGCNVKQFGSCYRKENYFDQNGKKVVLFVGRLAEKKGVTYLIDAMKRIDALLIIVGSGPLEDELRKQAEEQKDRVRFLGAKSHDELKYIYASADVFAAPSIVAKDGDKEGLGLVILEAMASGLPVVASASGGIIDVIADGENGLLCREKDSGSIVVAVNRLLGDEKLYEKVKAGAYRTAQEYDYSKMAERYAQLLNGLCKE